MEEKKLAKIIGFSLIGLLLLFGTFYAGYWLGCQKEKVETPKPIIPTPTQALIPTSTPTLDPTADWKTYINQTYNYSIKYPQEINISLSSEPEAYNWISFEFPEKGKWTAQLIIDHFDNPNALNPRDFSQKRYEEQKLESEKEDFPPPQKPFDTREIEVGSTNAFQVKVFAFDGDMRVTYVSQGKRMVTVSFYDPNPNDPFNEKHVETFNLMLQSFKFLD